MYRYLFSNNNSLIIQNYFKTILLQNTNTFIPTTETPHILVVNVNEEEEKKEEIEEDPTFAQIYHSNLEEDFEYNMINEKHTSLELDDIYFENETTIIESSNPMIQEEVKEE